MSKKNRVAIVGVGIGANYGSVLTYYSLYKTVEKFGMSPLLVSKIGRDDKEPVIEENHAYRFAKVHYNLSEPYNTKTVSKLNDLADTFILGSDQVWNYGISKHFGKAFYFNFVNDDKRKITYATSFGHAIDFAPVDKVQEISGLMKRFNAVSVREDSGVRLAKDVYDIPAVEVSEPIYLLSEDEYLELANKSKIKTNEKYLLAYILDPSPAKREAILHLANKLGLKPRVILDGWPHLFEENKKKLDLDDAVVENVEAYDFLKLYMNSSYVITDSFHGTSFALKFRKPFTSIGNKKRGMARFESLFRLVGHKDRFTTDPKKILTEERFIKDLDYSDIDKVLEEHITYSKKWLHDALKIPVKRTIGESQSNVRLVWNLKSTMRKMRLGIQRRVLNRKASISAPLFETNNDKWIIKAEKKQSSFKLRSPKMAIKGNRIWCDLPLPLDKTSMYNLTIDWSFRTTSKAINIHLRNPVNNKFKVVGSVIVGNDVNTLRNDIITIKNPPEGYTQLMFGAVHFAGPDGGADISKITIVKTNKEVGNVLKTPAEIVNEYSRNDSEKFIKYFCKKGNSKNIGNARALLMFYSHGLEKGLSRSTNFRAGFGEKTLQSLAHEMSKWLKSGRDINDPFFQIALSALCSYFLRHDNLGYDIQHIKKLFSKEVLSEVEKSNPNSLGGVMEAHSTRRNPPSLPNKNFVDVVFSRNSIREYTSEAVSDDLIRQAMEIAVQTPSVCNRQAVRVHQYVNEGQINKVLDLQGGFRGYRSPPNLFLLTCDLSSFIFAVERNQPFIDGGLFMMTLLLALEQVELGACALNAAMSSEKEDKIRRILNIPESEVFISFIIVGHYENKITVPRSTRISPDDVFTKHE